MLDELKYHGNDRTPANPWLDQFYGLLTQLSTLTSIDDVAAVLYPYFQGCLIFDRCTLAIAPDLHTDRHTYTLYDLCDCPQPHAVPYHLGWSPQMFEQGMVYLLTDHESIQQEIRTGIQQPDIDTLPTARSLLLLPLEWQGVVFGSLNFTATYDHAYSPITLRCIGAIVLEISRIIGHLLQRQTPTRFQTQPSSPGAIAPVDMQALARHPSALSLHPFITSLTTLLADCSDLQDALTAVLRQICNATGWCLGEVWIPETDQPRLYRSAIWYGEDPKLTPFHGISQDFYFELGQGIPGRVWQSKTSEWQPDVTQASSQIFSRVDAAIAADLHAALGVPILVQNQVFAVLLFFMNEVREADPQLVETVTAIAERLGTIIQLKQTKVSLQHHQDQLTRLINSLPGIVFASGNDPEWSMTFLSDGCYDLLGYQPHELLEADRITNYTELTHADDRELVFNAIDEAIARRQPYVVEYRIHNRWGQVKWVWEKGYGLYDEEGCIQGLEGFITEITSRKQTETALQDSESRLRAIFDNAAIGIGLISETGRILDSNAALQTLLGYTAEELYQTDFDGYHHPNEQAFEESVIQAQQSDRTRLAANPLECRLVHRSGQIIWGRLTVSPLTSEQPPLVVVLVEDITHTKAADQALRDQQRFLRLIIDNIPQHIFWKDRQSVYRGVNKAWADYIGLDNPDDAIGTTDHDFWDAEFADRHVQRDRYVMGRDRPQLHLNHHERLADGREHWKDVSRIPIHNDEGEVIGILGTFEDITERVQAEEAIRDSEKRYRLLAEHSTDLITRHTIRGVYLYVSPAARGLLGYEPEDLIGQPIHQYVHSHDQPLLENLSQTLLSNRHQDSYQLTYRMRHHNGTYRWFESTIKVVRALDAETIQDVIVVSRDVTDRQQASIWLDHQKRVLEMIATDCPLEDTLTVLVEALEQQRKGILGSILLVDPETNTLQTKAAPNLPKAYCDAINGLPIGPGIGCCGTAAHTKQRVAVSDTYNHPYWEGFQHLARQYNLRACWSTPIMSSKGEVLGTFGMYHPQSRSPQLEDWQLMDTATHLAGIAIERRQTDQLLRQTEIKYRSIFENSLEGIFQTTIDGQYVTVNPMLADIYGYDSPTDLMNSLTSIRDQLYVDPSRRDEFEHLMTTDGMVLNFESEIYRKDGSTIWISECARAIYDEYGNVSGYEGTVENITQRKISEAELYKRDRLLGGVAAASHELLTNPDFHSAIQLALRTLGQAVEADRAYIYENHPHPVTGAVCMSMRFEWVRASIIPSIHQFHWQNQQYCEFGLERWYKAFSEGKLVHGPLKVFPNSEQELLERDRICSMIMMPIQLDNELWGYIGFDDCHRERHWTSSEESILSAIAASISGAIKREKSEDHIRYQAFHDALTGLPNRSLFEQQLPIAIADARQSKTMVAIAFLDLDRFKTINDTLGHAIGDEILKHVTQRLQHCLKSDNLVARWGGDEFTLMMPHLTSPRQAANAAERIANALRPAFYINGHELHINVSIGIALYPQDGGDLETLLKHADSALYRVKEQGRDHYQFYNATLSSEASERLTLSNHLYHALDRQEFVLYYQPQIDVATGEITQLEALLRWQHSYLGLIAPQTFIPIAEDNGLIVPIGEWVLQAVCEQISLWADLGLPAIPVAVNLSARQFQAPNLQDAIATTLRKTGVEAHLLEIEITETAAMQDMEFTCQLLNDLRQMGVRIAMDDFGTGYSSLNYLRRFPLHTIKIDRSFVKDIANSPSDEAIISAIVTLGKGLNLTVVAEGVETTEQVEKLRSLHCDALQGYWFSRPLPTWQITELLQSHAT
jgi:diguanylate cyclase (GGDEF)-like protein/PAS domain S-box-containing protein